jgi:phage terminase Nu1 subunit (DNA packaging protein)
MTEKTAGNAETAFGRKCKSPGEDLIIKPGALADHMGLTTERLRQLARDGHIPVATREGYPLIAAFQGYIRFLSGERRDNTKTAAAGRVSNARAREIEMRNARAEGSAVDMEDVEAVFSHTISVFRSELSGVPAGATRDRITRAAIKTGINGAITRCQSRFEKASQDLMTGRDPLDAGETY